MRVLNWVIAAEMRDEGLTSERIARHFGVTWNMAYRMIDFGTRLIDREWWRYEEDPPLEVVLSRRAWNVLTNESLIGRDDRLSQLCKLDHLEDHQLLMLRNFGRKSLHEVRDLRMLIDA